MLLEIVVQILLETNFNFRYHTLAKTEIIYPKKVRAQVATDFT